MWEYEYAADTPTPPAAVWRVLREVDGWASWDTSMESVRLQGPFEVGSRVVMTPIGQEPITSVIIELAENEVYADETRMGEAILRFSHTLHALPDGGTRVVHRLENSGPAADDVGPELGPAITEDFPEAMDALLSRAAS